MEAILFDAERHYAMLVVWWKAHKFPPMPLSSLPKLGLLIASNGVHLAAGFIYTSDSDIAWLEWLVVNPEATKEQRNAALPALIHLAGEAARLKYGARLLFTSTDKPKLEARLVEEGFLVADTKVTFLFKELGG